MTLGVCLCFVCQILGEVCHQMLSGAISQPEPLAFAQVCPLYKVCIHVEVAALAAHGLAALGLHFKVWCATRGEDHLFISVDLVIIRAPSSFK